MTENPASLTCAGRVARHPQRNVVPPRHDAGEDAHEAADGDVVRVVPAVDDAGDGDVGGHQQRRHADEGGDADADACNHDDEEGVLEAEHGGQSKEDIARRGGQCGGTASRVARAAAVSATHPPSV